MYGDKKSKCKFCGTEDESQYYKADFNHIFHICNNCGLYFLNVCLDIDGMFLDRDMLEESKKLSQYASFFYYNKKTREDWNNKNEGFYVGKAEVCNQFKKYHKLQDKIFVPITDTEVLSFYPSTLSGKETLLLRDIYKRRNDVTNKVTYTVEEMNSAAFVIRHPIGSSFYEQYMRLLNDLENDEYIEIIDDGNSSNSVVIEITTKGIKRIEEGEKSMEKEGVNSEKTINVGPGATYVENFSGNNNIIGNTNNLGVNPEIILKLVDNIYFICNENKENELSSEIIESINDNLTDIREYVTQNNSNGILKRFKTIKGLLQSGTISIAANLLTPEISAMINRLKACIGA